VGAVTAITPAAEIVHELALGAERFLGDAIARTRGRNPGAEVS
jgi:hypothetical protein